MKIRNAVSLNAKPSGSGSANIPTMRSTLLDVAVVDAPQLLRPLRVVGQLLEVLGGLAGAAAGGTRCSAARRARASAGCRWRRGPCSSPVRGARSPAGRAGSCAARITPGCVRAERVEQVRQREPLLELLVCGPVSSRNARCSSTRSSAAERKVQSSGDQRVHPVDGGELLGQRVRDAVVAASREPGMPLIDLAAADAPERVGGSARRPARTSWRASPITVVGWPMTAGVHSTVWIFASTATLISRARWNSSSSSQAGSRPCEQSQIALCSRAKRRAEDAQPEPEAGNHASGRSLGSSGSGRRPSGRARAACRPGCVRRMSRISRLVP